MTVKIKKIDRVSPGFGRVSPGQFPSGFLPQPGPVPGSGRPGPGSTHRAGPGFKTLVWIAFTVESESFHCELCLARVWLGWKARALV
jgi:hypothetical protein